jgi:predicted O-methyltransferase YrrM
MKKQKINTNLDNIRLIKSNTFFLMDQLKKNEKFDLIWVDGGHLYPDIAWDLCNAYYLLNEGGILLCDDIIMSDKKYKTNYVSTESWEVLKYIEQRISSPITFLLKRLAPTLYSRKYSRKYVAVLKKKYIKQ